MNRLIAIVGPTGIGKSQLAIRLAQTFAGEIISADSRQVYRYMDIGTAKPSSEELALAPHHLMSIVNPDADFSLAQYQKLAYAAIRDIEQRHKLPLLVGGSGLYVWAVLEGWEIPGVAPKPELRQSLEAKASEVGAERLYQELLEVDPLAAQKIDPRNVRRIIRALEVYQSSHLSFSQLKRKKAPPFTALVIGLTTDRKELYRRVDARVDEMVKRGLIDETKKLLDMGYGFHLPSMSGIGYRQIGMYLRGELTLAEAVPQIKFETHRFIRHQYAWFKLNDKRIHWFDAQKEVEPEIKSLINEFIRG